MQKATFNQREVIIFAKNGQKSFVSLDVKTILHSLSDI
jgi:hypothetical protein